MTATDSEKVQSNSETLRSWVARILSRRNVETLSAVALAVAAGIATASYVTSIKDRRVDKALEFLDRFYGPTMSDAQIDIERVVSGAYGFVEAMEKDYKKADRTELSTEMRDRLFAEGVARQTGPRDDLLPSSILKITSFFGGLQVCIELETCDRRITHELFDDYATSFWEVFRPAIILARESGRPGFSKKMQRFVEASRS